MDGLAFFNSVSVRVHTRDFSFTDRSLVIGFSDHKYFPINFDRSKKGITHNMKGCPYDSTNVNDCVDKLLEDERTIGFATDSMSIGEHLKQTGNFEFERDEPVRYRKNGRVYQVF